MYVPDPSLGIAFSSAIEGFEGKGHIPRMGKAAWVFGIVCLLTGCQSEQPANQVQAQKLGETCQAYGFKPGTDQFAVCIFQLDQQRIASNRQRRMAIGAAMGNMGAQMQAAGAANRPINCTSTLSGTFVGHPNQVQTSCY